MQILFKAVKHSGDQKPSFFKFGLSFKKNTPGATQKLEKERKHFYVKSILFRRFFWSIFFHIPAEYGDLREQEMQESAT